MQNKLLRHMFVLAAIVLMPNVFGCGPGVDKAVNAQTEADELLEKVKQIPAIVPSPLMKEIREALNMRQEAHEQLTNHNYSEAIAQFKKCEELCQKIIHDKELWDNYLLAEKNILRAVLLAELKDFSDVEKVGKKAIRNAEGFVEAGEFAKSVDELENARSSIIRAIIPNAKNATLEQAVAARTAMLQVEEELNRWPGSQNARAKIASHAAEVEMANKEYGEAATFYQIAEELYKKAATEHSMAELADAKTQWNTAWEKTHDKSNSKAQAAKAKAEEAEKYAGKNEFMKAINLYKEAGDVITGGKESFPEFVNRSTFQNEDWKTWELDIEGAKVVGGRSIQWNGQINPAKIIGGRIEGEIIFYDWEYNGKRDTDRLERLPDGRIKDTILSSGIFGYLKRIGDKALINSNYNHIYTSEMIKWWESHKVIAEVSGDKLSFSVDRINPASGEINGITCIYTPSSIAPEETYTLDGCKIVGKADASGKITHAFLEGNKLEIDLTNYVGHTFHFTVIYNSETNFSLFGTMNGKPLPPYKNIHAESRDRTNSTNTAMPQISAKEQEKKRQEREAQLKKNAEKELHDRLLAATAPGKKYKATFSVADPLFMSWHVSSGSIILHFTKQEEDGDVLELEIYNIADQRQKRKYHGEILRNPEERFPIRLRPDENSGMPESSGKYVHFLRKNNKYEFLCTLEQDGTINAIVTANDMSGTKFSPFVPMGPSSSSKTKGRTEDRQ